MDRLAANRFDLLRRQEDRAIEERFSGSRRVLVTFGEGLVYEQGQRRINGSALQRGDFTSYELWNRDRIRRTRFYREHARILDADRGSGYWLWKPFIIKQAMDRCEDGDFVLYTDCGPQTGGDHGASIWPLIAWLAGDASRLGSVQLRGFPQRAWTKADCFALMQAEDDAFRDAPQVQATFIGLIVGGRTRTLVDSWLAYCSDERIVTDQPNTCGRDDDPSFVEHRHDQSVLTNLCVREGFVLPSGPHVEISKDLGAFLRSFASGSILNACREGGHNVSDGKPFTQSTPSPWADFRTGRLPAATDGVEYFFHTAHEDNPHVTIDLLEDHLIDCIIVRNRKGPKASRARRMRIEVGPRDGCLSCIYDAVVDRWDFDSPLLLCGLDRPARIVRLSLDDRQVFHLEGVEVLARRGRHGRAA